MATPIITEKELRIWCTDRPELNTLVDGVRFAPEDIEQAMINTVDRFNIIPPPTGINYTVENFPSRSMLSTGAMGWLLKGAAIGEASNHMQYSAMGIQVDDRDKAQLFASMGDNLWQEFIDFGKQYKLAQNIARVYGVTNSEYRWRAF